jgi:dTDP-4-amino-4,6-dideoxygalactose transaminase
MKSLDDYTDPFDAIKEFEHLLQEYTGASHAIVTDCCTHAIEIALRIRKPEKLVFPNKTYLSVIMLMHKIDIKYELIDKSWFEERRYHLQGSDIWDCARYFRADMFQPGEVQCLSFNRGKPLAIGRGGAILTDDADLAARANRMRYDGRDIFQYKNWPEQQNFEVGYHYYLRPEDCVMGIDLLRSGHIIPQPLSVFNYPDCRAIKIVP